MPSPNRVGRWNGRQSCRGWARRSAMIHSTAGSCPMPRWLAAHRHVLAARARLLTAGPPVDDAVPLRVDGGARHRQGPGQRRARGTDAGAAGPAPGAGRPARPGWRRRRARPGRTASRARSPARTCRGARRARRRAKMPPRLQPDDAHRRPVLAGQPVDQPGELADDLLGGAAVAAQRPADDGVARAGGARRAGPGSRRPRPGSPGSTRTGCGSPRGAQREQRQTRGQCAGARQGAGRLRRRQDDAAPW